MIRTVDFDTQAILEAVHADGVVLCERVLDADRVAAIRADLDRVLETTPTGRNDFEGYGTKRIYNLFAKTRAFDELAIDPVLLGVLDDLLGHYQLSAPTGIQIGPGEPAQGLHTDDSIYPLPQPHGEVVVNTMWAFDDFTRANGATRFVEGSHRWGPDRWPTEDDPVVDAEMPAGSVAFYSGSIWHGGGANATDRPRLGVILEYAAAWLRPQENHVVGVTPEVVATLPERLQELLGYNIFPPFVGYVDGRHPKRFLPAP
ncbi:phytanoyl-CoA dioxygenase family protein [Acidimicrobiia bacterium EGI L10123]|uniref:phytanoyl-CoA dioxygenase family protein n=1 Tax=Salinilacustrithrix flava TaxID=2957203 RepID=UPI003D7C2915|nr:phytanoyl-CoA dioxygenase family protein [Acidimicrobiia bacterium EGI L10123]